MEKAAFDHGLSKWMAACFAHRLEVPLAAPLAAHERITPQAANARLRKLIETKALSARLEARTKLYRLAPLRSASMNYERERVEEDRAWSGFVQPLLEGFTSASAMRVLEYGTTEMVNYAKDHSEVNVITVSVSVDMAFATIIVSDDGEGIFARIRRLCGLVDERESLLELAKGKLTTAPENPTGEGVFFSSRALDHFVIFSSGLAFTQARGRDDFLLDHSESVRGTTVVMRHAHTSSTELQAVFNEFAAPEEFTFSKTVVPLRLAIYGNENLMSRSQARRVLARIERFKTVILDFEGSSSSGKPSQTKSSACSRANIQISSSSRCKRIRRWGKWCRELRREE